MFEKEVDAMAVNNAKKKYGLEGSICMNIEECAYVNGFQQGAEFGYNKANEWHYVKDGDLPKAYQKCYFIYSNTYGLDGKISFSKSDINVLTGIYAFILDEETGEETTETCFYDDINDEEIYEQEVYAWKEIVLPKEIE